MLQSTVLNCKTSTAKIVILAIAGLFLLIGCTSLLRSSSMTQTEAAQEKARLEHALVAAAAEAVADIHTGLAEGHDIKTLALTTGSEFLWKMIAAGASTAGLILSGLMAKWLGTERKITKVLITAIENTDNNIIKETVHKKALDAGVEPKLAARVQALT